MGYPKEFFYKEAQSGKHYQRQATGTPDFTRLIRGHADYWIGPTPQRELKKKKLIISDWNKAWTVQNLLDLIEITDELLNDEFEVYCWQDGEIIKLNKDNIPFLLEESSIDKMPAESLEKITEAAASQHGLSADEILILDSYWVKHLASDDDVPKPRSINLFDFLATPPDLRDNCFRWMRHITPPLASLVHDVFFEGSNEAWEVLSANLPDDLPVTSFYRFVCLNQLELQALFAGETITSSGMPLTLSSLERTERFDLRECTLTSLELVRLLTVSPNLRHLMLGECEHLAGGFTLPAGKTLPLEVLEVEDISAEGLQALLKVTPKLRVLSFSLNVDMRLPEGTRLPFLNVLSGKQITTATLQDLLSASPNLKYLDFDEDIASPGILSLAPGSLPFLEKIEAQGVKKANVQSLLAAANKVKNLSLENVDLAETLRALPPNSLTSLQIIKFNQCLFTVADMQHLLAAAPSLKKIILTRCRTTGEPLYLAPGSLKHVEEIDLEWTNNILDLHTLSAAAPRLKKLNLSKYEYLPADLSTAPNSLRYLEDLNLCDSNVTGPILQAFLSAAPNLKILTLVYNSSIRGLILPPGSLSELEELNLSGCDISASDLKILLLAAPNVKNLQLSACKNIAFNEAFDGITLNKLERINIKSSSIKPAELEMLSRAVPKIKLSELLTQITSEGDLFSEEAATSSSSTTPTSTPPATDLVIASLDANTTPDPSASFHLKRIFYPLERSATLPVVNHYRQSVFHIAQTNRQPCTLTNAFFLANNNNLSLIDCSPLKSATEVRERRTDGQLYYGKQTLNLTTEWQALASLSPHEELLRYNTTPDTTVEIKYSTRDNLYYMRSSAPKTVDIDFTLHVPNKVPTLPEHISALVNDFLTFGAGTLDIYKPAPTGTDYLTAILTQKKGACRHRAFAFKALMSKLYPDVDVRVIYNECHAFVEIKIRDQWVRCDLGGYPARLEIDESHSPDGTLHGASTTHTSIHQPTVSLTEGSSLAEFERALQTWERNTSLTGTPQEYYANCLNPVIKKRLIECTSAKEADALHYALMSHCRHTSRPVFYVNSPDDLICSSPYMYRHSNNRGELRKGPGGPLHDFLTRHPNGVIIVNYGAFKADDIVHFNGLLDKRRNADGTDIPPETVIIGLLNHDAETVPGSDFYSRFDKVETCPLTSTQLLRTLPVLPTVAATSNPASHVINLFHTADWEEHLLGRWVSQNGTWVYEEGELVNAIRRGMTAIEIQNGLWDNKEFCRFWREVQEAGTIHYADRTIPLPRDFSLSRYDGYDWITLKAQFQQETILAPGAVVLNLAKFGDFFKFYQVTDDKKLLYTNGLIQKAKEKTPPELFVHVTNTLSESQWARLLQECRTHHVKLRVYCAPGIELPVSLQSEGITASIALPPIPWSVTAIQPTQVIKSNDVDATVTLFTKAHPDTLVIDISECHESDLFSQTKGEVINIEGRPLQFEFSKTPCAVAIALAAGKTVILKGRCSKALADELAPLLLDRLSNPSLPGRLMVMSEDVNHFQYFPLHAHTVSHDEKRTLLREYLGSLPSGIEPYITKEPFVTLKTRCRFMMHHPDVSSDLSWLGLHTLPETIKDPGPFVATQTESRAQAFMKARKTAIEAALAHEPSVFLAGLSGAGKSTFVTNELCGPTDKLYIGESALLSWAMDKTAGKRKLLFIDEANLSPQEWSLFEGLFQQPPGILIKGQYYPLSPQHKVIFAGNPLSYGDERKLAPFFERHGNTVVFEPLPSDVLFERILKPVFNGTGIEHKAADISRHFLEVYRFLCQASDTDVLISPRELQMMALLTVSYRSRHAAPDVETVAKYIAYHLGKHLVPVAKESEFKSRFETSTLLTLDEWPSTDFLITPSRHHVSQLLEEFLKLRELRNRPGSNDAQRYGGLGGMILEGEPGIGKSELVIAALRARGYEETRSLITPAKPAKPFYRMPVSMSLSEKETLLRKAFDEGAVVVIDEINSSPMMEQLLNALLMGTTPEGTRPKKTGFMVIGTQNPITMSGRRAASPALSRRMTTIELPPYTSSEMQEILCAKGVPTDKAEALTAAYQSQAKHAKEHQLTPPPTFRDVLKLGEKIVHGQLLTARQHQCENIQALLNKYFGPKSNQLGGLFDTYIQERANTYWFQDLCSHFAALMFGCLGFKTDNAIRKAFLYELQSLAASYHDDPSNARRGNLTTLIDKGLKLFTPRAPKGSFYEKSLQAKLSQFKHELEAIPSPTLQEEETLRGLIAAR